jgi:uncharacterized membrane protein
VWTFQKTKAMEELIMFLSLGALLYVLGYTKLAIAIFLAPIIGPIVMWILVKIFSFLMKDL